MVSTPEENNTNSSYNNFAKNIIQCRFCSSHNVVKFGFNKVKGERKQRYWCKDCNVKFTPSSELVKSNTYFSSYSDLQHETKENLQRVCRLAKKTIYPFLNLDLHYTAKYETKNFMDLLAHVAIEHDFTENGSKTFKIDRKESPVARTLLYHLRKLKMNDVMKMFTKSSEEIFKLVRQSNIFKRRKFDIAIDFHDIPYWGDEKHPMLVRTPKEQGTTYAFRFATVTIVEHGKRFTLLTLPVSPLDNNYLIVDYLISYTRSIIPIDIVYLDRGFFHARVIDALKDHHVKFLMVAVRNEKIKRILDEYDHGIIIDYIMGESTTFKLAITKKDGEKQAFATNLNVGVKRRLMYLYELYGKRWGIETSYRVIDHDFKARTTSKKYVIRFFYFLFGVILYNLWVLTNILLCDVLLKFFPKKLLATAKYFGKVFVYVDPG